MVESLADPPAVVESVTIGDTWGAVHALVKTLAETLIEVEVVGETRGDAHALVDTG